MQIFANTYTFVFDPNSCVKLDFWKYSINYFWMRIHSFFMQMHANTLVFYANPCKYAYFLCKCMQIQSFFMQMHANTNIFYANTFFAQKVQNVSKLGSVFERSFTIWAKNANIPRFWPDFFWHKFLQILYTKYLHVFAKKVSVFA